MRDIAPLRLYSAPSGMGSDSLFCLDLRALERFFCPDFRKLDSRLGMAWKPLYESLEYRTAVNTGSSRMAVSARKGSARPPLWMLLAPLAEGMAGPGHLRSRSFSRSRSLELMYNMSFWRRPVFFPQLSWERRGRSSGSGAGPGSMERLPMLLASSLREPREAEEEARERLLPRK